MLKTHNVEKVLESQGLNSTVVHFCPTTDNRIEKKIIQIFLLSTHHTSEAANTNY